ncbi:Uncharacterised protein [Streptococcus pneumoniae]|nr:Uncharacterised protein [Streptococcus pneumoniae]CIV78474.1 Uncharacterised protein [Streptococcus pneumoniae]CRF30090.1 Uncharacterised protein [Streptococcus pneumoniae]
MTDEVADFGLGLASCCILGRDGLILLRCTSPKTACLTDVVAKGGLVAKLILLWKVVLPFLQALLQILQLLFLIL